MSWKIATQHPHIRKGPKTHNMQQILWEGLKLITHSHNEVKKCIFDTINLPHFQCFGFLTDGLGNLLACNVVLGIGMVNIGKLTYSSLALQNFLCHFTTFFIFLPFSTFWNPGAILFLQYYFTPSYFFVFFFVLFKISCFTPFFFYFMQY